MKTKLIKIQQDTQIDVSEDIQYVLDISAYNKADHYSITLNFEKSGVRAELLGFFRLKKDDVLNLTTIANHKVPHTACETNIRGVLYDNAQSTYTGKIVIQRDAQQTSSFLHDGVLIMGDKTKNRSDPILEIEADDVKASHGATTGQIDKKQLYYLKSRGLRESIAKNLIVDGFFESLLSTIKDPAILQSIRAAL